MFKKVILKSLFLGIGASLMLLAFYFLVMALSNTSFAYAISELIRLKIFVVPLILSFGVDVGLIFYARDCGNKISGKTTIANTAISGTAMLACCAHHLTDIVPIIGLSIASAFLIKYQVWFLAFGLFSNTVGIGLIIKNIRKTR